jgi:tetratricopeptide (TPR) repeat protein
MVYSTCSANRLFHLLITGIKALKLSPAAHRNVFLIICLCLTAALVAANVLADRDEAAHKSYYGEYEAANALFESGQFEEPYEAYKRLSLIYPEAYILELKMVVCSMNMGMWAEAAEHSRRTLERYPLLAKDEDFMKGLIYILKALDRTDASLALESYLYDFAISQ